MSNYVTETTETNYSTGETQVKVKTTRTRKTTETFLMMRTTNGLGWMYHLNNLTELILFVEMVELANPKLDHLIQFNSVCAQEIAFKLKLTESMISKSISSLIEKDFLRRVSRGNYIANPKRIFKGLSKEVEAKYREYIKIKNVDFSNNKEHKTRIDKREEPVDFIKIGEESLLEYA